MVKLALRILLEVYLFNFVDLHVAELDQNRGVLVLLVELVESELLLIVLNGGEEVLLPEDLRNGVDLEIELVVDGRHIDLVASPDVEAGLLGDVIADGVGIEVAAHGQFLHVLFLELVLGIDIEDLADGDLAVGVLHDEVLQADLLYWLYYDIEFKLFGALSKFRNKSQCLRVVLPAPDHLALEADVAQVLLDVVVDRLDDLLPQGGTVAGQLGLDEKRVLVDGAVLLLQLDGVDVGVEHCGFGVLGGGPGALAGAGHQHTC